MWPRPWRSLCTAHFQTWCASDPPSTWRPRFSSACSATKRCAQFRNRLPADWITPVRRNLRQRFEDEPPFAETRMRDDQSGFIDHRVAIEDEIKIERSRRSSVRTRPAEGLFDLEELLEERM